MDGETLQQNTTHNGRENSKLQDLQKQMSEQIQGTTGHNGARPKVVTDFLNMCGVSQHANDTQGRSRQGTNPR